MDKQEAAARYTAAAEAGSAEALSALGDCLYYGRGTRKNKTQARRMWKKAAQAGEVQAMIALGDDCAASGGEMAETLQYYRRAQSAAREVPDSPAKRRCCRLRRPCRAFGSCRPRAKRMLPTGCGRLNC